ncbi:MAG: protein-L-isoaspartate O-methyltransferase family protein [Actinomycetota bacterium]
MKPAHGARARAAEAMRAVRREAFLPAEERDRAHLDLPLPIGWGATNSQPTTVLDMLELLDVQLGDRVLDLGAGSGWTTGILAHLAGAEGSVLGLEIVPELAEIAAQRLREAGAGGVVEKAEAGVLGAPDRGPFDRILVSADAGFVPITLADQLAEGGRMVLPAAGEILVVDREAGGFRVRRAPGRYGFVRLVVGRGEDELRG